MPKSKTTVKCKVIGPFEVGGVFAPDTVELDPTEVNIDVLVKTGHVELIDKMPDEDELAAAQAAKTARTTKAKG